MTFFATFALKTSVCTQIWREARGREFAGLSLVLPPPWHTNTPSHAPFRGEILYIHWESRKCWESVTVFPACQRSAEYIWHKPSPCAFVTTQTAPATSGDLPGMFWSPLPRDELGHLKESTEAAFWGLGLNFVLGHSSAHREHHSRAQTLAQAQVYD